MPVEHRLSDAVTQIRAMAPAGVLVLQFDGPGAVAVVGKERVEIAGWSGDVTPECWELCCPEGAGTEGD